MTTNEQVENTAEPTPEPSRAEVIAAIHAYGTWLATHPDVPVPSLMAGSVFRIDGVEPAPVAVRAFGVRYSGDTHVSARNTWTTITVPDTGPLQVHHIIYSEITPR